MTTSAREFSALLSDLLRREHAALAEFLVALSEFDQRRLWVDLGHPSLFSFLTRELGLSSGAAFYRKTAAELLQRFPGVIEPLREGRLCFTTIVEVSKCLTAENFDRVLPRFFHTSKREAKAITAELQPDEAAPRRTVVTAVRQPACPAALALAPSSPVASSASVAPGPDRDGVAPFHPGETVHANSEPPPHEGPPPRRAPPVFIEEPLTAEISRIHVTVPRAFLKKLDAARAALSHSHPGASKDEILAIGLDLIIERHAKRRGLVEKPRSPKAKPSPAPHAPGNDLQGPGSRGAEDEKAVPPAPSVAPLERPEPPVRKREPIPAHVKRAVWQRDGGRCQWPIEGGGVCGSTHQLEIDHIVPVALGGRSTVENCELTCRVHNDLAARKVFGDAHMDQFTGGARKTGASPPSR